MKFIPAVIVIFILISCNSGDKTKYYKSTVNGPDQKAENITLVYTDSGVLRAKMLSPVVEQYYMNTSNAYMLMNKGVLVYFYTLDKNKPSSKLKSNYAKRIEAKQIIELKGNIEVVNEEGDTLNTETLIWDERSHMIHSKSFVRIKKKKEILYGDGFESNEDFTKYKIFKLKGTIYRESGEIN